MEPTNRMQNADPEIATTAAAREASGQALTRPPQDRALRLREGVLLREAGRIEESLAHLLRLAADAPGAPWVAIELAATQRRAWAYDAAAGTLAGLLAADPRQRQAHWARIDAAAQELRLDLALEAVEAALDVLPGDAGLALRRCNLTLQRGHVRAARDLLDALAADRPGDPGVDLARGHSLLAEDPETALALAGDVVARAPGLVWAWPLRIAAARTLWRFDDAEAWGREAETRFPGQAPVLQARVATRMALEDPQGALALLPMAPDTPAIWILRGTTLLASGRPEEADAAFAAALDTGGLLPGAAIGRIGAALELDRVDEARAGLSALIAWHEARGHRNGDRIRAEIAGRLGDWPEAERLSTRLLDRQGPDRALLYLQARARFGLGRIEGAVTALDTLGALDPDHSASAGLRGELHLAAGRPDAYVAHRRALFQRPDSARTRTDIDFGRDLDALGRHDEASARLQHLLDRNGDAPNLFLSQALMARGRVEEATAILPRFVRGRRNITGGADEAITRAADLERLFDFETARPIPTMSISPAASLAWRLARDRSLGQAEWTRRAERASAIWRWLTAAPAEPEALLPWLHPGEADKLRALPRPCILTTTHFGPLVYSVLRGLNVGYHYLAARSAANPAARGLGPMIAAATAPREAAAEAFRVLRGNGILMATHDSPARVMRQGGPGDVARGRLFGRPFELIDTLPKLAAGLRVPSLTLQAHWRDGRIAFEIAPLPTPEDGEPTQMWLDRWAQVYLDRIEWIMSGPPENQNLDALNWRVLLLDPPPV
ncbi:tetratricopeptide repeat protein [Rhodovulum sp. BSW8]|uniref:tetratricopeptide repeat protein n=1 Tax=Rhodovulum sp. BSW8 TaxID=2259645 RepID=UPI001A9F24B0|nr:tetratricopeptide repeat protein [Rhodovulum sp. BSW8]